MAMAKPEKEARYLAMDQVKQEILAALGTEVEGREKEGKSQGSHFGGEEKAGAERDADG